ncbi:MAG TPA: proton-conducting transporter membrane subunit, partial [Candidatus Nitrosotalea sp.]|nr:proton-conducting transporter membrane subunit [Candidatus Nitrosotalea sp.]
LWNHSPNAQLLVGGIGAITALAGAILGTVQWDIKRILAYSTMSQIGYMIMGVGVGAYEGGIALFFTHAFFKAQLFLGAGLIIHALNNEQDVRKMGGLWKKMPFAFWVMLTAVLAITGVPGFSGFFSKDEIIYGDLQFGHPVLFAISALTAGITAYYMFRMLFIAFFGEYRGDVDHAHAPGWTMNVPVAILVAPSVAIGAALLSGENSPWSRFFASQFGSEATVIASHRPPAISEGVTSGVVFALVLIGFAIAWWRYASAGAGRDTVQRLDREAARTPAPLKNLFYFDDIIQLFVVRPTQWLGEFFGRTLDPHIIDGAVRDVVFWARWLGALVRSFQTGFVRAYALILAFGAAIFIAYYAVAGVSH